MAMIRTDRLTKAFGRTRALDGLTLDVPEGSVFALVGPNGAGKTTAVKTLMNILQPDSGRAEVLGVDTRRLAPISLRGLATSPRTSSFPSG
jgi:ABC-2 type transport system ATP-binding protein